MTFGNAWQVSMRGSSFNEEESGVGLALEQHSTRLKGMMGGVLSGAVTLCTPYSVGVYY